MDPTTNVYPLEFGLIRQMREERRFSENAVKSFVHKMFALFEHATSQKFHEGAEAFRPFIADDIYAEFPDDLVHSWEEFAAWHRKIHAKLDADDHRIRSILVRFLSNGKYQAEFDVLWRGLFKDGTFYEAWFKEVWTLREEPGRDWPVIERCIVRKADFRQMNRSAFPAVYDDKG